MCLEFNLLYQLQLSCYLAVGKEKVIIFYKLLLFFFHWIFLINTFEDISGLAWVLWNNEVKLNRLKFLLKHDVGRGDE